MSNYDALVRADRERNINILNESLKRAEQKLIEALNQQGIEVNVFKNEHIPSNSLSNEHKDLRAELDNHIYDNEELQEKIEHLEFELRKMKEAKQDLQQDLQSERKRADAATALAARLTKEVEDHHYEKDELQERVEDLTAQVAKLQELNKDLRHECKIAESRAQAAAALAARLGSESTETPKQEETSRGLMDKLESKIGVDINGDGVVGVGRKALLVGINYYNTPHKLDGCVNDVRIMLNFLKMRHWPSDPKHMRILVDDPEWNHDLPTQQNILEGLKWLCSDAKPGDSLFFHYSGHGVQVMDTDGDEEDKKDEALVPCDHDNKKNLIRDDQLHAIVSNLPEGVRLTCLVDCCHSGTVLDLSYQFTAGRISEQMESKETPRLLRQIGENTLKADILLFSGCLDEQTASDVKDRSSFNLPVWTGPGQAGGVCTSSLVSAVSANPQITYIQLLEDMRKILQQKRFKQIPQMTCSRPILLSSPFSLEDPMIHQHSLPN